MSEQTLANSLDLVSHELDDLVDAVGESDPAPAARALDLLDGAERVFVHGAGRSGLALRMTAMRLMHLGLDVHVVGEVTTPAIEAGDVLLTASGSGTTSGIVQAARTAVDVGAQVVAVSTTASSPLAELAEVTLVLPAATKTDRSGTASAQYAGSLFEQGVVLLGDALFHALWQRSGHSADDLWPRHANLE
ncbi:MULTISPECIES: 6-phospho-3-hexuloisomerase [unclassified Curtobacterium]|uniref:6-phospho-3-hexuloisomerase n=1 Tax=unclassified Curtobacterium TaxID=257496 RepID=UPI000DAA9EA7|nr:MULTISPECIES: 6-phospho-3-hexuloisomerase [unclassified Curtobacterium]PZE69770.1 6-phospho-3-hexuloisomerase [Curtobacterium sp. MCBD17_021]WIB26371.1 6-phospho-3-hexuloisomerase [Curtobacterium sp. MCSS17_015]